MYFDDKAVRVKSLFHSQIRSIGTFTGIAFGLFGFSDRFTRFGFIMRVASVAIMSLVVWFALTADMQYVKYVNDFPPGEQREDMLTWRIFPLVLSVILVAVASLTAFRKIA